MKTPLHRIRLGAFSLAMVVLVSITGYRFFGGYDWLEAIWMVVITISTVGFSEKSGLSPMMQVFTICVICWASRHRFIHSAVLSNWRWRVRCTVHWESGD